MDESEAGRRGFFWRGVSPRGPRVLPATYAVRLEAGGNVEETEVAVRLDPRVEISAEDLQARQEALLSAYRLARPIHEAQEAIRRLRDQLNDVGELIEGHEETPEALAAEVEAFEKDLEELSDDLNDASAGARTAFAIDASTTRPTADQLWQLEEAWTDVPPLIDALHEYITQRMPAVNRQLDEHGIRPDPGAAIEVPRRG